MKLLYICSYVIMWVGLLLSVYYKPNIHQELFLMFLIAGYTYYYYQEEVTGKHDIEININNDAPKKEAEKKEREIKHDINRSEN